MYFIQGEKVKRTSISMVVPTINRTHKNSIARSLLWITHSTNHKFPSSFETYKRGYKECWKYIKRGIESQYIFIRLGHLKKKGCKRSYWAGNRRDHSLNATVLLLPAKKRVGQVKPCPIGNQCPISKLRLSSYSSFNCAPTILPLRIFSNFLGQLEFCWIKLFKEL